MSILDRIGAHPVVVQSYVHVTNDSEFQKAMNSIDDYCINLEKPRIGVDTETKANTEKWFPEPYLLADGRPEGEIQTIQIGLDPDILNAQYIFNMTKLDHGMVAKAIKPILESERITKIGQNLKYDWKMFYRQLGIYMRKMRDTMLISQCLNSGDKIKHNLSSLFKEFLEWGWFRDTTGYTFAEFEEFKATMQVSDWSGELTNDQLIYASGDVGPLLFALYKRQMERLVHSRWGRQRCLWPMSRASCKGSLNNIRSSRERRWCRN